MVAPWPSSSAEQPSSVGPEDTYASSALQESQNWASAEGMILLGEATETDEAIPLGIVVDSNILIGTPEEQSQALPLTVYYPEKINYYEQLVKDDGAWGAWHLDEPSGTIFADYSGNNNDLNITGTLTAMAVDGPSPYRKAASFPSNTGVYATGPNVGTTAGLETWEAWVKLDAAPAGTLVLLSGAANATGTANVERGLRIGTDLKPRWAAYGGSPSGWTEVTAPLAISTGEWHHIVGVLDGTNMRLYVDGIDVISTAKNTGAWGGRPIRVHAGYGAGNAAAVIANTAMYPVALTAPQIAAHYVAMDNVDSAIEYSTAMTPISMESNVLLTLKASNSLTATSEFGRLMSSDVSLSFEASNELFFEPDNITPIPQVPVLLFPTGNMTINIESGVSRWFRFESVDELGNFLIAANNKNVKAKLYILLSETETSTTLSTVRRTYPDQGAYTLVDIQHEDEIFFLELTSTEDIDDLYVQWGFAYPPYYDYRLTPYTIDAVEYGSTETLDLFGCTNEYIIQPGSHGTAWMSWDYPNSTTASFVFECSEEMIVTVYVDGVPTYSTQSLTPTVDVTINGSQLVEFRIASLTGGGTFSATWSTDVDFVEPETFVDQIRVEVYERDGITKITELPNRLSPQAQEVLNGVGSGSFQVHADDPIVRAYEPTLFRYRNIVKFFIGTKCIYAFRIRNRDSAWVTSSEYTGTIRTISGPAAIDLLNDAQVVHDANPPRVAAPETRVYNWTSHRRNYTGALRPWYKDSEWSYPFCASAQSNPPGHFRKNSSGKILGPAPAKNRKKYNNPKGWPFPTARWIFMWPTKDRNKWFGRNQDAGGPNGNQYYRYTYYCKEPTAVRIACSADEWYGVWLNGEQIIDSENYETGYKTYTYSDQVLNKGWHIFSVYKKSIGTPKIGDGSDAMIFGVGKLSAVTDTDSDKVKFTGNKVLFVSKATGWACYMGKNVPGWNRAMVLESFLEEMQERKLIGSHLMARDWNSYTDSYGKEWPRKDFDKEVGIGTKGTEFLQLLTEANGFDVWMDPGAFKIRAALRRGKDKSASIRLEPRRNVLDWNTSSNEDVINAFLVHYDGGWLEYEVPDSIAKYGRTEGFITLGDLTTPTKVIQTMDKLAAGLSKPAGEAGSVDVKFKALGQPTGSIIPAPGAVPFLDFEVGDHISALNEYGNYDKYRVMALTVSEDANGQLSFDPELELVGVNVDDTILTPPTGNEDEDNTLPDPGDGSPAGLLAEIVIDEDFNPIGPDAGLLPQLVIDAPTAPQYYEYDGVSVLWWKIQFDTPGTYYIDAYDSTTVGGDPITGIPGTFESDPYVPIGIIPDDAVTATMTDIYNYSSAKLTLEVHEPVVYTVYALGVTNIASGDPEAYGPCLISVKYYQ